MDNDYPINTNAVFNSFHPWINSQKTHKIWTGTTIGWNRNKVQRKIMWEKKDNKFLIYNNRGEKKIITKEMKDKFIQFVRDKILKEITKSIDMSQQRHILHD